MSSRVPEAGLSANFATCVLLDSMLALGPPLEASFLANRQGGRWWMKESHGPSFA